MEQPIRLEVGGRERLLVCKLSSISKPRRAHSKGRQFLRVEAEIQLEASEVRHHHASARAQMLAGPFNFKSGSQVDLSEIPFK